MGKPFKDRSGEIKDNNFGSKMIIKKYKNYGDIDIYFPEYNCTVYHKTYNDFKNGKIYCPYEPRVYGIGYFGIGEYKVRDELGKNTKAYTAWHDMLRRCYNNTWKEKHPTYENCYVNEEWLNYQNFAEWFYQNYYEIDSEIMNLDKDILIKYNNEYGPNACVYTPHRINNLFIRRDSMRGELPIGVRMINNKFEASCSDENSKKVVLGLYDTQEEAFNVYKEYKEKLIKEIADEYKEYIPYVLYEAMYNYEVEIDD